MDIHLTTGDLEQIDSKGIIPKMIDSQLKYFKNGFEPLDISRAATVGDGIIRLSTEQVSQFASAYDCAITQGVETVKFVPASGAATRMFKELYEYVQEGKSSVVVDTVLNNIKKFAFYDDLVSLGVDFTNPKSVIEAIIFDNGLGYGSKPKGLIRFHKYSDTSRAPFGEHLVEGALYSMSRDRPVQVHFTISVEHKSLFDKAVLERLDYYKKRFGVDYQISFSYQNPSTDTVAVDMSNNPLRDNEGKIVFRPAGHGALIDNLNELDSDVIFIKTIDNVVPDHLKNDTTLYKKALAGLAVSVQSQIFEYIREIDNLTADPQEIIVFIESTLGYRLGEATNFEELRKILDRPLRVCGMVINQGEPGGGPYWVRSKDKCESLQILESSQIPDHQKDLINSATHFNPVDLVCCVKNYKGEKFDLTQFVDPNTGFISEKSFKGQPIKAQELPGLWNGAMADWNTLFVEVPPTTFAPVKTVVDLLRAEHQK